MNQAQRLRLIAAMGEVCCSKGIASASVADVVARAGVSRRTFYDVFDNLEDCFLEAFEEAVAQAQERILPVWGSARPWTQRIRASMLALLTFFDEEPVLAYICLVQAMSAGPAIVARRGELTRSLARRLDEGRAESRGGGPPPMTAEGLVGAVLSILHARLQEQPAEPLRGLSRSLISLVVLPYLGQAAAQRELSRPLPRLPRGTTEVLSSSNPMQGLGMRLTYRTLRVITVIAASSGASNREISQLAGVSDQGQISKLLARLERVGLIENSGAGHTYGARNAWALTAQGETLYKTLQLYGDAQDHARVAG